MFYPEADNVALELRGELYDVFQLSDIRRGEDGHSWMFTGRMLGDADGTFNVLQARFSKLGFVPLLRQHGHEDIIFAAPVPRLSGTSRWIVNLGLFLATIVTTLMAGATMTGRPITRPLDLLAGAPFAVALLAILGTHELGHYFAARLHGLQVTLPYFIPIPPPLGLIGTMGAFIQMRSPVSNKKALFDIGLAGPLAGLLVAIPLTIIGLSLSPVQAGGTPFGGSLLFDLFKQIVVGPIPHGFAVKLNPIAIAGWFGLLVTAINLIPAGQLDGGHIGYAVFGRAYPTIARLALIFLLGLGFVSWNWYMWAGLIYLTGLDHPPTLNAISPLDPPRRILGIAAFILGLIIFSPVPFRFGF